jgi:hypothetical protein
MTHRMTSSSKERQHLFADTIARLSRGLDYLDSTLLASTTLPNREKIIFIRDELCQMIKMISTYNPFDDISIKTFYSSLSHSVTGTVKYTKIDGEVSTAMMKNMFPFYIDRARFRGYSVMKCTDQPVAPFIYPCWLAVHHRWPQKDELPLYLCKQLFV